ncbi:hypothetical protein [Nonomuraea typhae]|uniref:hypothetical protein n=1 Tax=Nonomuraea typhae TaxID=2603600 RepID=UPI0012F8FA1F|nr:hypothetical protein [Nonomuraea typhae]
MDEIARLMAGHDPAPHEVPPDELLLAEILGTARPRRGPGLSWRLTFGVALATGLVIVTANAMPAGRSPGVGVTAYFRYPGAPLALCGEPGSRPRRLPEPGGGARRALLELAAAASLAAPAPPHGYRQVTVASSRLLPGGRVSLLSRQSSPLGAQGRRVRTESGLTGAEDRLVQSGEGRAAAPYGPVVLPADPGALRGRLVELGSGTTESTREGSRLLGGIVAVNASETLDGPRTAAVWRVLAARPGLHTLGLVTDRRERDGVGIAVDTGADERWVLVADRGSGDLLGVERLALRDTGGLEVTTPCVRDFWTFVTRKWAPVPD